ncbi:hypothetical protein P8452_68858 [Trifolium repens]|nr:hypothetical protein P8452_68858 [Trifolium repens]
MRSHNSISKRRRNKTLPVGEPSQGGRPTERLQVPMVDFAENDDNVIEISSSAFVEAAANVRRIRRSMDYIQQIDGVYINLEEDTSEVIENATKAPESPKEPSIICPICMGPSVEETTTRCGHIFCKNCIKSALTARRICPVCGVKATMRGLVRVYLPSLLEESSSDGEEN